MAGEKVAEAVVAVVVAVATDTASQLSACRASAAHCPDAPDKARTRPIRGANDTDVTPQLSNRNG